MPRRNGFAAAIAAAIIGALHSSPAARGQNIPRLTTEHVDLNATYSGGSNGIWTPTVRDDDNGIPYAPADVLMYVGPNAQTTRLSDSSFAFIGVGAGETYYRLPASQDPNLLYLGVAAYDTPAGTFDRYNAGPESKGRVSGTGRWLRWNLRSVSGPGQFSVWQSGDTGPNVFLSTFNDNISNPNGTGLDATDGIGADDSLWIVQGGHVHYNWGFTERGFYDVTFRVTGFLENNDAGSLGQILESQDLTFHFDVLSETLLAPEPATPILFCVGSTGLLLGQIRRRRLRRQTARAAL